MADICSVLKNGTMKASLCFVILALFQNCYGTPTFGALAGLAKGAIGAAAAAAGGGGGSGSGGDDDCESGSDGAVGAGGNGGSGLPGLGGLGGIPGVPGLPAGAGLSALPLPGASGAGSLCPAKDDPDCSPIVGYTFAQPAKVAAGDVGTISLTAPQIAIVDKAKSELVHGAEAALEAVSHLDVDKFLQILLNTVDKVVVRAGQLVDSIVPGLGLTILKVYAAVSSAAHIAVKGVSKLAVGVTGGEAGLVGGALL